MRNLFFTNMLLILLVACGGGSDNNSPGVNSQSNLTSRWPGTGSYSYNLNHNGCRTQKTFSKQYQYCLALKDNQLNNDCALSSREKLYLNKCGNDFSQINIEAPFVSGWDEHLQKSCRIFEPAGRIANDQKMCDFLKDESLHLGCHWQKRKELFDEQRCDLSFSEQPAQVDPTVDEDIITEEERPRRRRPLPQTRFQLLVEEFKTEGIELKLARNANRIPRLPGERSYQQRLNQFITTLDLVKQTLFTRVEKNKEISISTYSIYDKDRQSLTLGIDLNENEILDYLKLLDRKDALEKEIAIDLDLGIHIYGSETQPRTQNFARRLDLIFMNKLKLKAVNSVVKVIETSDYSSYSSYNRELTLAEDDLIANLDEYIAKIMVANKFYKLMDKYSVEVDNNIETHRGFDNFRNTFSHINTLLTKLEELIKVNALKEISLYATIENLTYFGSSKKLSLGFGKNSVAKTKKHISSLIQVMSFSKNNNIPVDFHYDLDENFSKSVTRLSRYKYQILRKKGFIKKLYITSRSQFSYGTLYIGHEESESDFLSIINNIK